MKIFCYNDLGIKYLSDVVDDFPAFREQAVNDGLKVLESEFFPFKTNADKSLVRDENGNYLRLTDIGTFQKGYISLSDLKNADTLTI